MSDSGRIGGLGDARPKVDPRAWVAPGAVLVGRVRLGPDSSVWYGAVLRADEDEIIVGAGSNIQDLCCLHVDPSEPVVLEERVTIGHRATVHGAYLESGCLIGIGAVVLGGARVGAGALVAAGAVVLGGAAVPSGVLYAGVPGRVVRELTDADRERFRLTPERYIARAARHRDVTWRPASSVLAAIATGGKRVTAGVRGTSGWQENGPDVSCGPARSTRSLVIGP